MLAPVQCAAGGIFFFLNPSLSFPWKEALCAFSSSVNLKSHAAWDSGQEVVFLIEALLAERFSNNRSRAMVMAQTQLRSPQAEP